MRQDSNDEDGGGREPALSLDSPWAWFYYSTFAAQLVVVTAYVLRNGAAATQQNTATALDMYVAALLEVSTRVPGMAAYSLLIAVTVEVTRMIVERYLAKRFRQGKREGIAEGIAIGEARAMAEVLDMLDEDTRKEVERKLRRNGNSNGFSQDE